MQGIGYALSEEQGRRPGDQRQLWRLQDSQYAGYPGTAHGHLSLGERPGSLQRQGHGENPIGPVAPAHRQRCGRCCVVRIKDLPITAEKVYRALVDR